jgi:hypothetical protein
MNAKRHVATVPEFACTTSLSERASHGCIKLGSSHASAGICGSLAL